MSLASVFWMIYIIALVFGLWLSYEPGKLRPLGSHGIYMALAGILGWAQFGAAIHK